MSLAGAPVKSPLSQGSEVGVDWRKWFQAIVTAFNSPVPGPFADDAAAKAAGINIGFQYYQPTTGAVVVRLV